MRVYGFIFDRVLSPAFPPLGQQLPLIGWRHEHLVDIDFWLLNLHVPCNKSDDESKSTTSTNYCYLTPFYFALFSALIDI